MALLLLAIAEFQFGGTPERAARSRSRARYLRLDGRCCSPNRADATLMDVARANALGWLRAVPSADRVLLVRADASSHSRHLLGTRSP